ncbi:MAG: magnesium chelatase domain-containing protein [Chthoniobacter sp.]|nr:magnesium chelatase domain-containing protein [Chthoniobacter sp.]
MLAKVYSAAVYGVDAFEVEIEVNGASGNSVIVVVGLPDVAVKESKDRVTTAIQNSGYRWPRGRTTINLAPADVKKEGPSFDLPIALGMIAVGAEVELLNVEEFCFVGELALTGQVRPVKGVLPVALEARRAGRRAIVVPMENAREAAMVDGIEVYGVHNLREAFEFLTGEKTLAPIREDVTQFFAQHQNYEVDFSDGHVLEVGSASALLPVGHRVGAAPDSSRRFPLQKSEVEPALSDHLAHGLWAGGVAFFLCKVWSMCATNPMKRHLAKRQRIPAHPLTRGI